MFYTYNADGQRTSKSDPENGTTEFFYNGSILAGQKNGDNTITFMYDNNGDYFGFNYNGTEYYYLKNAQNDVIGITLSDGTLIVKYYYDAWGNLLDMTDANNDYLAPPNRAIAELNPIRYRSYYFDSELGFYYLNSRFYDPSVGRFINADGMMNANNDILGNNLFSYCSNDPVNNCDATGQGKISNWFKSAAQTVKSFISNAYNACATVVSSVADTLKTFSISLSRESNVQSSRPKNIGKGTYKKALANQAQKVGKVAKVAKNTSYAVLAAEVGIGIYNNIKQNAKPKKVAIDALVDLGLSGGSLMASALTASAVGGALGSWCPVAGNAVGAIVGFGVGIGLYWATDSVKVNGSTVRDTVKQYYNEF